MNHGELLRHCVLALDSFKSGSLSIEQHLGEYLKDNKTLKGNDREFVIEIFSGCVRHTKITKLVVDGFYVQDGKSFLKADSNLYTVICYLIVFRLDEIGMGQFKSFVKSQDISKMYRFLNFFLEDKNLKTWIKDEWKRIYEPEHVETTLLTPMYSWLPKLKKIVEYLGDKLDDKIKIRRTVKPVTESKPYKLTVTRPRSVPMPEPIPKLKKHRPVPQTTYHNPKEADTLAKTKEVNRRKAEESLLHSTTKQFSCANAEKSEKTKNKIADIVAKEDSKLNFEKNRAKPLPPTTADNIPVKLNAATILREGALYQRREIEAVKKLEKLEAGAKDASEFLEWQQQARQRDMDQQLAEIERKRLEGMLSHEEAILSRQQLIKENRQKVKEMKEEAGKMMQEYLERRLEEEEVMKRVVDDIMKGHKNAREAKIKLQQYKKSIVEEVTGESRELLKQALEEAEVQMRQKLEIIHQIKAMESMPKVQGKFVDMTQTAGYALLSEMSLAELKERLALCKESLQKSEEDKRDEILSFKQAKDQMLKEKLEQINRHRNIEGKAAALKLQEKRKARPGQKPEIKDQSIAELQRKVEARKQERLAEAEKMRVGPTKNSAARTQSLIKEKKQMEKSRWQEMERRREKMAALQSGQAPPSAGGLPYSLTSFRASRQMSAGPAGAF